MTRDLVQLSGNLGLVDEIYQAYQNDPSSVDSTWRAFFENGELPAQKNGDNGFAEEGFEASARSSRRKPTMGATSSADAFVEGGRVWALVNAYRSRGHLQAALDPLEMKKPPGHTELNPETYGFDSDHLKAAIHPEAFPKLGAKTLGELFDYLRQTYCCSIGLEFMHISTPAKKKWLCERMESLVDLPALPPEFQKHMLSRLIAAETFERFIHTKFPGTKRFSLEGGESLVPLLDEIVEIAGEQGGIELVLGMAHRGRLNVLTHVVGKSYRDLFSEFSDNQPELTLGGGDVKYHLGASYDHDLRNGDSIHLSLAYNPSHLEAVDPVVCGRVRGKQRRHKDWERRRIVGVVIHGDAAFAGQGLVAETLQLSNLHGYRTGGTVHIIVNNQIGFTASPEESRSTPYCTGIAKMIQCPIWHVNGEDLDAVARVTQMAMEYRDRFQSDVVIDLFCYRKFGHNEMDEPSFTQPEMYRHIQKKRPIDAIYGGALVEKGVVTEADVLEMRASCKTILEEELAASKSEPIRPTPSAGAGLWSPYAGGLEEAANDVATAVPMARLKEIAEKIATIPEGLDAHRKIATLMDRRLAMGRGEKPLDWGMGELLAYGTLLWEGTSIRLSGQDSARGTFSHRHALLVDQRDGTEYMTLGHLHPEQGDCRIYDSPLSEAGVLGFEFGYSLDFPDALVIWEAQFGDFANGAQVIFDQFIGSSEDKWDRLSGLTIYLPHGYEGQGPEHSSARLERFLQNAAQDNMQICQPTTPSQMFHLLRRQVVRPWRKPLIIMTPKSLLRLPEAVSSLEDLSSGRFEAFLCDGQDQSTKRLFMCSGRLYYDLLRERESRGMVGDVAIARVEQLYPWRAEEFEKIVKSIPTLTEVVWVQDEPANMGPQSWILPRIQASIGNIACRAVSRPESASPATGSSKAHAIEQKELLRSAFEG